jgi:hypothetical protein
MHRRVIRAFVAAAAAGAAVASAGLASAVPASASSTEAAARPVIKTVIDTNFAGYVTTGRWRFRYVAAAAAIAKCRKTPNQNAAAGIALKSNAINEAAHIDLFCGGGSGSVRFGTVTHAEGMLRLSPRVGDVLKISVFRDVAACRDRFSATNTRTHRTKTMTVRTPCRVVYRHANLGATLTDIAGTWKPPAKNVRLWSLQDTAITSYNGTRGTICGPWPAEKHLAAPVITIRMIPSSLSGSCRDFSVLLKGSS